MLQPVLAATLFWTSFCHARIISIPLPVAARGSKDVYRSFRKVRASYVEEVDDKTLLENAIRGMLSGLDPHSAYVVENEFDALQETTTGEFESGSEGRGRLY